MTQRGPAVALFALGGLFVSVSTWRLIRLNIGLGEPGVFLVWGPLMVVGTFFVATGQIPGWAWIASPPYAILVTTVSSGSTSTRSKPKKKVSRRWSCSASATSGWWPRS